MFTFLRSSQKFHLFILMAISSAFSIGLLCIRLHLIDFNFEEFFNSKYLFYHRKSHTFLFLIWNLFLAWIPYFIALLIPFIYKHTNSVMLVTLLGIVWLLFFPNAPYLLTDLVHLKKRMFVPFWFDMMMFLSFAWTGLILGLLSLLEIHDFLRQRIPNFIAHLMVFCFIQLSGIGIYMGRFQRWNSWDIIASPMAMIEEVGHTLLHPIEYGNTLGIAAVISGFMMIGYLIVFVLRRKV